MQARARANELDAGTDPEDAVTAELLREWATARARAGRRRAAGMTGDAEAADERAESLRQQLADRGHIVGPTPDSEKSSRPATAPSAGGARKGSARRSSSSSRSRTIRQASSAAQTIPGVGPAWSIAGAVFVGSIALILLLRLVNEKQGGPTVVKYAAAGTSRLVDLIINPVDPFASTPSAAAGASAGGTVTVGRAATPAVTGNGSSPTASRTATR